MFGGVCRNWWVITAITAVSAILGTWLWISEQANMNEANNPTIRYVSGYFQHDQQPTGPENGFRAHTLPNFGILERVYPTDTPASSSQTQWERFATFIRTHNAFPPPSPQLKVLFVGRHGEGVHNVKEHQVGRAEWDHHWSKLTTDGTLTWHDARLTAKGIAQAQALAQFWRTAVSTAHVPAPERYYVSPLTRGLETARRTFAALPAGSPAFRPVVVEALRELHGGHTCDARRGRAAIAAEFPGFEMESGFAEEDGLWRAERREGVEERGPWILEFLERVFAEDGEGKEAAFVSITTHAGTIRALCRAIGHPDVWVAAGAVVPIVISRG